MYEVKVIETDSGICIKTMPAHSLRHAEILESSVNINLNHEDYYTEIVEILEVEKD